MRSVLAQGYGDWELWLIADAAQAEAVAAWVAGLAGSDPRIRVVSRPAAQAPAAALNAAAAQSTAAYVARMDLRDRLRPHTLFEVIRTLNEEGQQADAGRPVARSGRNAAGSWSTGLLADFIYTDEDWLDARGRRRDPLFKPQWSPDTLLSFPYTGDLALFRRELFLRVGGYRSALSPCEDYDLALRVGEQAEQILRVPGVLYHRGRPLAEVGAESLMHVKADTLARRGLEAVLETPPGDHEALAKSRRMAGPPSLPVENPAQAGGSGGPAASRAVPTRGCASASLVFPAVRYRLQGTPLVSIIVPTRNHADDVRRCVTSLDERTDYPNWELLLIDNGSDASESLAYFEHLRQRPNARCLRLDIPFNFARLNNLAAAETTGEVLLFMNNDVEALEPDWLERMLGFAQQPHIGAVGARLGYPEGAIQHAGVARVGSGPTHVFNGMPDDYPHPRAQLDGNWSAVTAACLMIERRKFEQAGGFDESFPVAYNDVDLCLKLLNLGYFNVLAARARLMHREFATRGNDRASAEKHEHLQDALRRLYAKWPQFADDPGYNPNLSVSFPDFMPRN